MAFLDTARNVGSPRLGLRVLQSTLLATGFTIVSQLADTRHRQHLLCTPILSRILSYSEHNHVQAFHTVGAPNAIRYKTPEMHLISPVPLSGVKELYANNDNDQIEQDEPDMMELLGK